MKFFNHRFFLYTFFIVIVVGLLSILSANIIIDPFYRFNFVDIPGMNTQRYQFSSNVRMAKPGAVCRINPTTVILGTSRAEIGLNPHHPGFSNERAYNLAMAGTGIQEMSDTLRHAIYAAPQLHQAIITLDFLLFNAYREEVLFRTEVADFDPARLLKKSGETCIKNFFYDANRLVGFNGLPYVLGTLQSQRPKIDRDKVENMEQAMYWMALYDAKGFRGGSYEVLNNLVLKHGISPFDKDSFSTEEYYTKKIWRAGASHRYCFVKSNQPNTLEVFRNMLRLARQAGLDVKLIINPAHSRLLIAIQEVGLWPQYEDWKRALVKIIAEDSAEHKLPPYELWDFSGFNSITTEKVYPANSHKLSKWYWDPSHYRKETGNMVLNKILGIKDNSIPKDFGMKLDQKNIESWLSKTLILSRQYIAAHKNEINKMRKQLALLYKEDWTGSNCGEDEQAVREGAAFLQQGNTVAAKNAFKHARDIYEANKNRAMKLGVPFREFGFARILADGLAGKTIEIPLESWQDYQERGQKKLEKSDYEGAIKDFTVALKDSPPNPALYFLRGTNKLKIKDYKGAEQDFIAGLKIDTHNEALKKLLANAKQLQMENKA